VQSEAVRREVAEARPVYDDREIEAVVEVLRRGNFDLGRSVRRALPGPDGGANG